MERVNEELRRRERVIWIFPNEQSLIRLMGALLMEIHEGWQTGRVYLNLTEYWAQKTETTKDTAELSVAS